ncbi:hypothetical protein IFT59_20565 [Rhizobium sp. CFBP 8752]|nr:hypothetical protein [Rhizobium sp. CFBP 8752]
MHNDNSDPTVARGLYRILVLFMSIALGSYLLWEMFSTTAALSRLAAAAGNFPYVERCDVEGNPRTTGQPNCVDLSDYLFINGPVLKAIARVCPRSDKPPVMLTLEQGKASREDIVRVEKGLRYRKENGSSVPC